MIDVNRHGEKCECQPPDFDLLPSFLLEIGDNPGPVAVYVNENRYNKYKREHEYSGNSTHDQKRLAANAHSSLRSTQPISSQGVLQGSVVGPACAETPSSMTKTRCPVSWSKMR